MKFWRKSAVAFAFSGVFLTALFVGCTRQIAVNPTSAFLFTSTPTVPLNTNTPTNTPTLTITPTPTITATPNGPTATPTTTPTITQTFTPAPPTNTFTVTDTPTITLTPTVTPTVTITSTPTPNCYLIDDFEGGNGAADGTQVNTACQLSGYLYCIADSVPPTSWGMSTVYTDGVQWTSAGASTFALSAPGSPTSPNYCMEISGTVGPACGTGTNPGYTQCPYVGMCFNFLQPQGPFNLNTMLPSATGVKFMIKGNVSAGYASKLWATISDTATNNGDSDGNSVNYTGTWTQITLPFSGMAQEYTSPSTALDITTMIAMQFKFDNSQGNGGQNYDVSVDDIYFY